MTRTLIALVEDEEHLAQGLIFNLEAEGYRVHHESDGDAALDWLLHAAEPPAAVLLDVMLPGRDGFSIAEQLRAANIYTPVLMLTARGRTEDIVQGFASGADDYLAKPFELDVLFARLTALLRRTQWQQQAHASTPDPTPLLTIAGRTVDFNAPEVRDADKTTRLTLMEADLLRYLLDRPNTTVSRKEILEHVWRVHEDTDTRPIDNFIVRLRRLLEPDPAHPVLFQTVRGIGYRYVPPA